MKLQLESKRGNGRKRIFLIIPYIPAYAEFEIAIWLTAWLHCLEPVVARPVRTGHRQGTSIKKLIRSCCFAVADPTFEDRLNVMFELGLAWDRFRNPPFQVALLHSDPYKLDERLSDLRGACQVIGHGYEAVRLLGPLSEWFESDDRSAERVDVGALRILFERLVGLYRSDYGYNDIMTFFNDVSSRVLRLYKGVERLEVQARRELVDRPTLSDRHRPVHASFSSQRLAEDALSYAPEVRGAWTRNKPGTPRRNSQSSRKSWAEGKTERNGANAGKKARSAAHQLQPILQDPISRSRGRKASARKTPPLIIREKFLKVPVQGTRMEEASWRKVSNS